MRQRRLHCHRVLAYENLPTSGFFSSRAPQTLAMAVRYTRCECACPAFAASNKQDDSMHPALLNPICVSVIVKTERAGCRFERTEAGEC